MTSRLESCTYANYRAWPGRAATHLRQAGSDRTLCGRVAPLVASAFSVIVRGVEFLIAPEYELRRDALPHGYVVVGEPTVVDEFEVREWNVVRPWDLEEDAKAVAAEQLSRATLEEYRHDD